MAHFLQFTDWKLDDASVHGGMLRSQQIRDLWRDLGLEVKSVSYQDLKPYLAEKDLGVRAAPSLFRGISAYRKRKRYLSHRGAVHRYFDAHSDKGVSGIIWENTRRDGMQEAFIQQGLPVFAFPHNIETLCAYEESAREVSQITVELKRELESLSQCDHLFGISEVDTLVHRGAAIHSVLFSYLPPKWKVEECCRIAEERDPGEFILLMGSCSNAPTEKAFRAMLTAYSASGCSVPLHVAGNGTDSLKSFSSDVIDVLGRLTETDYRMELTRCKAALVFQPYGTGAMTKISEYLLAGVPVISTPLSIRGNLLFHTYLTLVDEEVLLRHPDRLRDLPLQTVNPGELFALYQKGVQTLRDIIQNRIS